MARMCGVPPDRGADGTCPSRRGQDSATLAGGRPVGCAGREHRFAHQPSPCY